MGGLEAVEALFNEYKLSAGSSASGQTADACLQEGGALLKLANYAMQSAVGTFRAGLKLEPTHVGLKRSLDEALHRGKGDVGSKVDSIMDQMDDGLERCMRLVRSIRDAAEAGSDPSENGKAERAENRGGEIGDRDVGKRPRVSLAVPRIDLLLVTANTGSLFEDSVFEAPFLGCMQGAVLTNRPGVVVINFQEMCGKHWKTRDTKETADDFSTKLEGGLPGYWSSGMLFRPAKGGKDKNFTALATAIFIREDIVFGDRVGVWDFDAGRAVSPSSLDAAEGLAGSHYRSGCFKGEMFPEIKLGRKGWLHTRLVIDERPVDFVNVHLFHDASNLVSLETKYPSVYARCRKKAFEYVISNLDLSTPEQGGGIAGGRSFLFGDFNFRLELPSVAAALVGGPDYTSKDADVGGEEGKILEGNLNQLSIAQKKFILDKPVADWSELKAHDVEIEHVFGSGGPAEGFTEPAQVAFQPTYPFEEDVTKKDSYLPNRCPGWCDRIFMSPGSGASISDVEYATLAADRCVGDHKPVFLRCKMEA